MTSILSTLTTGAFPSDRTEFFRRHIRPDGAPWSFDGHEYLADIIADDSRDIVVRKPAQVGASIVAIGRLLADCTAGRKVGYYLPDRAFMQAFVQDRVDPLINADDALAKATVEGKAFDGAPTSRARRKSADNLRIKHIARGSAWFQGLQSLRDAKAIDLDAVVKDELTELDPELLPWLDDRLLHSSYKRVFALSQPGVPNFGIDAEFQASDQKFFLIQCRRCRRWCNLIDDWPDCLIFHAPKRGDGEWRIVCKRCGARVNLASADAEQAQWVPKYPGRDISGYALSQLYGPHCDADEVRRRQVKADKSKAAMMSLMVSIVGVPYAGDRQPLNDDVLARACGHWPTGVGAVLNDAVPEAHRQRPLRIAGIDTGDVLHVVIGQVDGHGRILVHEAHDISGPDQWPALGRFLRRYEVTFFVIDAQPYATNAKNLCREDGIDGAICYFNAQSLTADLIEKQSLRPVKVVKHDRTDAIDEMTDAMIGGELILPQARLDVTTEIKSHCKALVKDLLPTGKYAYKKGVENHYGLALTYLFLARRVCEMLKVGPSVPFGPVSSHMAGKTNAVTEW